MRVQIRVHQTVVVRLHVVTVFIRWLETLQVFSLFLGSLHYTVKRILRWCHRESLFSETWFVVLAFMVLFVLCIRFNHVLNLVSHVGIVASGINHWKSNY